MTSSGRMVFRDPWTQTLILEHEVIEFFFSGESEFQKIDVFETRSFGRVLALGGVFNATERDEVNYHEMLVHVPLFAHPCPKRVLIIGGGDGGTMREVVKHPSVEEAIQCEIDEMVVDVCKKYLPQTSIAYEHPKSDLRIGDGLEYVRQAEDASFDVILVDSTDPVDAGVRLFTAEFYQACHRILRPGGILVPQSDSLFFNAEQVRFIAHELRLLFDHVDLYTTHAPTYPSGLWTFTFASKGQHPYRDLDLSRIEGFPEALQYYNAALHRASFALPTRYHQAIWGE